MQLAASGFISLSRSGHTEDSIPKRDVICPIFQTIVIHLYNSHCLGLKKQIYPPLDRFNKYEG